MNENDFLTPVPPEPTTKLVWTAFVEVGERRDLGPGPYGHRFMVPILGGRFQGAPGFKGLNGRILEGGADRQVLRSDGIKELDAIYEMETDAGHVLMIRNRVLVDQARQPSRYAMSTISVSSTAEAFGWLNRHVFLGTLHSFRPERSAVLVHAWLADCDYAARPAT